MTSALFVTSVTPKVTLEWEEFNFFGFFPIRFLLNKTIPLGMPQSFKNPPGIGSDFPVADKLKGHPSHLLVLNFQEQTFPE